MKIFIFFVLICGCSVPKKFIKTNLSGDLYNFKKYKNLNEYTNNYRNYIKILRPELTIDQIERLAPFTIISQNKKCLNKKGFILIHGLSDSPFAMQDLTNSILKHEKCAIINTPIIPGNALIPGASLEATYKDWIATVDLSINDLQNKKVDSITIIGFSTGGALAFYNLLSKPDIISKIILVSPAFDLDLAWYESIALPILKVAGDINNNLGYVSKLSDYNPYKYNSFSANGIYQLNALISKNNKLLNLSKNIITPIFLIASMDDATIKTSSTLKFLENKKFTGLILGIIYNKNISGGTDKIPWIPIEDLSNNIVDLSHAAIIISPNNSIFGKNAPVNYGCSHYEKKSLQLFEECKKFDNNFLFGETNKENLKKYPKFSKIYYNPKYKDLEDRINSFLNL